MERTAGQRSFGLESGGIRDLCLVSASAGRGGGAGLALDVMGMRNFWRGTICGDRELWAGVGRKDGGALPLFIGRSTSARSLPAWRGGLGGGIDPGGSGAADAFEPGVRGIVEKGHALVDLGRSRGRGGGLCCGRNGMGRDEGLFAAGKFGSGFFGAGFCGFDWASAKKGTYI